MNKLYDLITFHNGTTPALNEDNLNAMSQALYDIDDRVIDLGGAVLDVAPRLEYLADNAEQIINDTKDYAESAEEDATTASNAATAAAGDEEDAEAWAVGERGGVPVGPTDPTYHNNAKYWAGQSGSSTLSSLADVTIASAQNGQTLVYDGTSSKWENTAFDKTTVGLGNVDNTADLAKPVSTAQQTALNGKADAASAGTWSSVVNGLVGDTTLTFNDANIHTTSIIDEYYQNTSNMPPKVTARSVAEGQYVITVDALDEATDVKLWLRNLS